MNIYEVRAVYSHPPKFSDEIGRHVSAKGATYRAWHDGKCHIPDEDANQRTYGQEGRNFGRWRD